MNNIQQELAQVQFSNQQGYWKSRLHQEFPDWNKLPVADFVEKLDSNHKKMWMNQDNTLKPDRLGFKGKSLIPLYTGIKDTVQTVVGTGFFMYSALVVSLHLKLAYYSRKLKVTPDINGILTSQNPEVIKDITDRMIALRIAAYIIYEGDGLGGYKDSTWLLWGRLTGKPCPTNSTLLSTKEAKTAQEDFNSATFAEKQSLFIGWWQEISEDHGAVPAEIVAHLFGAYWIVTRCRQMENPHGKKPFTGSMQDIQAAICGYFNRASKGVAESLAYDPNDLNNQARKFADMLTGEEEIQDKLKFLWLDQHGNYTPVGNSLLTTLKIHCQRDEFTKAIVSRQLLSQAVQNELLKDGFSLKINRRKY